MNGISYGRGPGREPQRRAFTLLEMLIVLVVVVIIVAASFSAFRGLVAATNLSSAAQSVANELTLAHQTAITMNEPVQVRFYQYAESTGASSAQEFQALQSFGIKGGTTNALEKVDYLPSTIMISSLSQYSSPLAGQALSAPAATDPLLEIAGVGSNYQYASVTFTPSGAISPPAASWYVTLYEKRFLASKPSNFATVNVDTATGQVHLFQP